MKISEERSINCPHCGGEVPFSYPTNDWTIRTPQDIYSHLASMGFLDREELRVILCNTKNMVQEVSTVYVGNVTSAVVRIAEILQLAVARNIPNIAVVHNHPSGDPTPSAEDLHLTTQIQAACKIMGIEFLDHIIIGSSGYISLKERGVVI